MHQFRIEARSGEAGQPTPEGMHRDGVDYVLVLLVGRRNIKRGVTSIHGTMGVTSAASRWPSRAMRRGWTIIGSARRDAGRADRPGQPAFRDVLVVTFRSEDG